MPHVDIEELKEGRKSFTKDEWIDIMLRSIGMEPDELTYREKWLLITRMIPLVENNFNLCELGPRSTGKSHLYKKFRLTVSWFPAVRQQLPIFSITWEERRLVWSACGTV